MEHDHEILRSLYDHLPSERKLKDKEKENVSEMLQVNANKKRIQQHISQSTGKVVLLKDIHNIKTEKNHKKTTPDDELGKIKNWLIKNWHKKIYTTNI